MAIGKSELQKIAKLSALKFSEAELEKYTQELNSIVDFCEKISSIDTSAVNNQIHPENKMPEHHDVSSPCDPSVMDNAPDKIANMFAVPKVIE